jgi:hypothetical protein
MKFRPIVSVMAAAAALSAPVWAADDHKGHDDSGTGAHAGHDDKARHGGVVRVEKDVNYELVIKPDTAALYIADHGKPVDLKGASAKLTLLSKAGKAEATLVPVGDRLEAKGSFAGGAGTKALATVTLAGQAPVSVRFTLK